MGRGPPSRARRGLHVEHFRSRDDVTYGSGTFIALRPPVHAEGYPAIGHRRQGSTQQRATEQLRALARPYRLRVAIDTEGFPVIPGRYGQIEWFDGTDLAVYTDRLRLFARLWAIPGVRRHQTGDTEMRAVFSPDALPQVARVIKARRRRTLSSDEARRRGFKPTHRATSGP
jgi:hypothetical protein